MNFDKISYQLILRYFCTETIKRRGEISLHKTIVARYFDSISRSLSNQTNYSQACSDLYRKENKVVVRKNNQFFR